MAFPTVSAGALPWLTIEQMAEADRLAVDHYGIDLLQMMEHAGAALADVTHRLAPSGRVVVLAGGGNNGGGGLCAARHLVNRGRDVSVVMASEHPRPAAAHHLATLRAMGVAIVGRPGDAPVVVDALVGYGLSGPLRGRAAELAQAVSGQFTVALDFPSGHGHAGGISAAATLTLALPKIGLGDLRHLYLADLGLPPSLWARMGVSVPLLFESSRILEITA